MKLVLEDGEHLEIYLQSLIEQYRGKKVCITIEDDKGLVWYRKQYFAILGELSDKSGLNKNELHDLMKENILPKVVDNPAFLKEDCDNSSTSCLNKLGWIAFNKRAKELIFEGLDRIYE